MRVIIVDDSKEFMALARRLLARGLPEVEVTEYDAEQQGPPGPEFDWSLYDVLLLDEELGVAGKGTDWLLRYGRSRGFPPAVLLAAHGDVYTAVRAMKLGAADYLRKQDATSENLVRCVTQAQAAEATTLPERRKLDEDAGIVQRLRLDPDRVPDGKQIGYRFVRLIGQGANSRVYLAERVADRHTLVLKVIDIDYVQDPSLMKRFVQEAELCAGLDSPYVVRLLDHGFTSKYGYIAMEFFTRGDLKQRIEHGVSVADALNYALHVALGLEAIHAAGIVHRDLKPGNIMFRSDDSLAIADFGISKRLGAGGEELTNAGSVLGTPNYISPEQGQGHPVDARSDIYSAGIILFEMLSGRKAFRADTPTAVIYQHVHAPVPRLPAALHRHQPLIDGTLAKRPEDRYQSASELVVNLQHSLRLARHQPR